MVHLPPKSNPTALSTPSGRSDREPIPLQRPWGTRRGHTPRPLPNVHSRPDRHTQEYGGSHIARKPRKKHAGRVPHSIYQSCPIEARGRKELGLSRVLSV